MIKKLTAALALTAVFGTSAQAAVLQFEAGKALTTTNWTDALSIGKFDSSLGDLTSIKFLLTGNVAGIGKGESLDAGASNVTLSLASTLTLKRPDGSTVVVANPLFSTSYAFSSFDGTIDFGGTSGASTGTVFSSASNSFTSTSISDFALFSALGGGNIVLDLGAVGTSGATGAGNLITQFNTSAGADVTVIYEYTAVTAVPEPETYGMVLLGLGLVGSLARRRAAKNNAA